jgi:hypothetical protein
MHHAVRCPYCDELSRVPDAAVGQYVACPNCRRPFSAVPEPVAEEVPRRDVPTVYPPKKRPVLADDDFDTEADAGGKSVLFGLALLPFVIPLLWILGPTLTGKEAIFTFALPMAIAVSSAALCLGVVLAADWSFATKVKSILAIVFVMHFLAALLYFMKAEWVEALRKRVGRNADQVWQPFAPPDGKYKAAVPTAMQKDEGELIAGCKLEAFRSADRADLATYFLAHGRQPADVTNEPDDEKFFAAVKAKAMEAANGTAAAEPEKKRLSGHPGREFVFVLPDRNTKRIVRVFRIGGAQGLVFVAAVEGVFLTPDTADVKEFFNRLAWAGK